MGFMLISSHQRRNYSLPELHVKLLAFDLSGLLLTDAASTATCSHESPRKYRVSDSNPDNFLGKLAFNHCATTPSLGVWSFKWKRKIVSIHFIEAKTLLLGAFYM